MVTLNSLNALPAKFTSNAIVSELTTAAAADIWLAAVFQEISNTVTDITTLNKTPAQWMALGVPSFLASNFSTSLANYFCTAVGMVAANFYQDDWPVNLKLLLAKNFLPVIVRYRGTRTGLTQTLALFTQANFLPTMQIADTAMDLAYGSVRNNPALRESVFSASLHVAGWKVTGTNVSGIVPALLTSNRVSPQFQTLELVGKFHNPLGYGTIIFDWLDSGADFTLAGDRCE